MNVYVLAAHDPFTHRRYYVVEGPGGPGDFRRADYPLKATQWDTPGEFLAWLDSLPPGMEAELDVRHMLAIQAEIDMTGTTMLDVRGGKG